MTKKNNNYLTQDNLITMVEGTIDASNLEVGTIDASNITTGYGIDVSRFVTKDVFENW